MVEVSRNACAFMIRSMFADQPYSDVTMQHGLDTIRIDTVTFSTFFSSTSFITLQSVSYLICDRDLCA